MSTPAPREAYDRAFELWPPNLSIKALNVQPHPYWLNDGTDRFWYRQDIVGGVAFIVVDPSAGTSRSAFDHDRLAAALGAALGRELNARALPISDIIAVTGNDAKFVAAGRCFHWRQETADLIELHPARPHEGIASPSGLATAFVEDCNLWLRYHDGSTRQITADGERHAAYATLPDHDRLAVARSRGSVTLPPIGCFWSPQSDQILVLNCDQRELAPYPLVESAPPNALRPRLHNIRMRFAGDAARLVKQFKLIDVASGAVRDIKLPTDWNDLEINAAETGIVHWSRDESCVFVLANNPASRRAAVVRIDRQSASANIVFEENVETFYDFNTFEYHKPNIAFLRGDRTAIWYSQRSGWGHLYLIDLSTGEIIRPLTAGAWAILDIVRVDEDSDTVLTIAGCVKNELSPYYRHLVRIPLSGTNAWPSPITEHGADHAILAEPLHLMGVFTGALGRSSISPSGRYFVDTQSTPTDPGRTSVRTIDGAAVMTLMEADISGLHALHWRAPDQFEVELDGEPEPIYGLIIKPRDFDPQASYPVVERIYAGPQIIAQARNFHDVMAGPFIYGAFTLAEMGFIVVLFDTPGTPCRSKAFHDAPYGSADRLNVRAHAQVLRSLALTRPWMDVSRCGVSGHSWGGHASAMALLMENDTYKVGVSSAGLYDPSAFFTDANEKAMGPTSYSADRCVRIADDEVAPNYMIASPSSYAERLEGRLLLAYGELDENALPSNLLRFAASLIAAGKAPDMLCLPGSDHAFFARPYFHKRTIDYFLEHLAERKPLLHYLPDARPGTRILI